MRVLFLLFSFILLFSGCRVSPNERVINIKGKWFYVDKMDTSYNELYFKNNLHFYNRNLLGVGPIFNYVIVGDSLFISRDGFKEHSTFLLKIITEINGNLLITYNNNDTIILEPLQLQTGVFYDLHIGDKSKQELIRDRMNRGSNVLLKRGLLKRHGQIGKTQDSIIFIPEPEH